MERDPSDVSCVWAWGPECGWLASGPGQEVKVEGWKCGMDLLGVTSS